jgi:hypothetical protein
MPRQWRHQSKSASITSAPSNMITSVPLDVTSASYPTSQVSTPMSSGSPVIGSGIHPDLANDISLPWNGMEIPLQPRPIVFGSHIRDSPDDLPFYSSPDTCGSPASDAAGYVLPPHPSSAPTSVMESFHYSDLTASPLQLPSAREWDNLDVVSSAPNMMPLALDGNQLIHPVGEPSSHQGNSYLESRLTWHLQNLQQCQYHSQPWMEMNGTHYEESLLPHGGSFPETTAWRSLTL